MTLYLWNCTAARDFRDGHIVVVGETLEAARATAQVEFYRWLKVRYHYLFDLDDVDSRADIQEFLRKCTADLSDEPTVIHSGAVVFEGSE